MHTSFYKAGVFCLLPYILVDVEVKSFSILNERRAQSILIYKLHACSGEWDKLWVPENLIWLRQNSRLSQGVLVSTLGLPRILLIEALFIFLSRIRVTNIVLVFKF